MKSTYNEKKKKKLDPKFGMMMQFHTTEKQTAWNQNLEKREKKKISGGEEDYSSL